MSKIRSITNAHIMMNRRISIADVPIPKVMPLAPKFWSDVIRLEEEIHQKTFNFSTIDELIQMYAKAIEYYDGQKDSIKGYFMEKIQITLASKESLRLIMQEREIERIQKEKQKQDQPVERTQIKPSMFRFDSVYAKSGSYIEAIDEMSDEENDRTNMKKPIAPNRKSLSRRKEKTKTKLERSQFVNMYMKVQNIKKETEKDLIKLIDDHCNLIIKNDQIIQNNIQDQLNDLKQLIERRRIMSLLNDVTHPFTGDHNSSEMDPFNPSSSELINNVDASDPQNEENNSKATDHTISSTENMVHEQIIVTDLNKQNNNEALHSIIPIVADEPNVNDLMIDSSKVNYMGPLRMASLYDDPSTNQEKN